MTILTAKCVSGSSDGQFSHEKLNFWLFQKTSFLADFSWFFWLRGQFWAPNLARIDPAMEAAIVRHDLRNISALGEDGSRADRPELQCKTRDFQYGRLPAQGLAFETLWIMWYTHLVLRLGSGIFGLPLRRIELALSGGQKWPILYLPLACR